MSSGRLNADHEVEDALGKVTGPLGQQTMHGTNAKDDSMRSISNWSKNSVIALFVTEISAGCKAIGRPTEGISRPVKGYEKYSRTHFNYFKFNT
jgi:hypothetical protein